MSISLRSISDHEILSRTKALTLQERKLTLNVLLHLNEIERRRLHLKQGYASMFVYCTAGLGYSASAAKRRICTARCIARFPQVLALLESNEVNLSTVTQVSRILKAENVDAVLGRICGRSQREVEAIVAEHEPLAALPRERVRTVVVRVPVTANGEPTATVKAGAQERVPAICASAELQEVEPGAVGDSPRNMNQDRNGPDSERGVQPMMQLERRALIQFSAREEVMTKLEQVRALASHRLPANAPLEHLIEFLADYFNEREDPKVRHGRREARSETTKRAPRSRGKGRRHVPARIRDQVFVRDEQQCTYKGPDGKRCRSARVLQIDHIRPVARGGAATIDNLRLLCAHHNRLEAERLMGRRARASTPH